MSVKSSLYSAGIVVPIVLASALAASASTFDVLAIHGAGLTVSGTGTSSLSGGVKSRSTLTYANDYVEFDIVPTSSNGTVVVDDLGGSFPNETWEIIAAGALTPAYSGTGDNSTTNIALSTGVDYYLRLASGPLNLSSGVTPAKSEFALALTPLPGAFALFAGGMGLLGLTGLQKRRKTGNASKSIAAV